MTNCLACSRRNLLFIRPHGCWGGRGVLGTVLAEPPENVLLMTIAQRRKSIRMRFTRDRTEKTMFDNCTPQRRAHESCMRRFRSGESSGVRHSALLRAGLPSKEIVFRGSRHDFAEVDRCAPRAKKLKRPLTKRRGQGWTEHIAFNETPQPNM